MKFAEWLIAERMKRGFSRTEFAKETGLRCRLVYELETFSRIPRKKTILKLEKVLGKLILPQELLGKISPIVKRMTKEELIIECKRIVKEEGIGGISYPQLKGKRGLYFSLYENGITQKSLVKLLGLESEYRNFREKNWKRRYKGRVLKMWTWDLVVSEVKKVVQKEGFLPPGGWFEQNGKGYLIQAVYNLGKTWEQLRNEFADFTKSSFVESRNGMRWRSHPEASLSNFLFTRGVKHERGERYPASYKKATGRNYGYFDLHFISMNGQRIDVEIWGDKPHGHDEVEYAIKRKAKEKFNQSNERFLGIEFRDCFSDEKLSKILEPFIGVILPKVFLKETDKIMPSSHWSNADELIECCRELTKSQPDGIFPTEEWLRKRGKWKNRNGEAYNTLSVYIKTWLGGVRKLRKILGQEEASTRQWDKETALSEYEKWFRKYGITPEQTRAKKRSLDNSGKWTWREKKEATNICSAIGKYVGGTQRANQLLGIKIDKTRRWTKEAVLRVYKRIWQNHGLIPSQFIRAYSDGLLVGCTSEELKDAKRVGEASKKYFFGENSVYKELGIHPVHIRIWMRAHDLKPPVIKRPRK